MKDKLTECPFCGQGVLIKIEENWDEKQIQREAIMNCKCDAAKHEQEIQQSINLTEMYIREEYPAPDDVKKLLLSVTDLVGRGPIEKITIQQGKDKFVMMNKSKGGLRVEKTTTIKEGKDA